MLFKAWDIVIMSYDNEEIKNPFVRFFMSVCAVALAVVVFSVVLVGFALVSVLAVKYFTATAGIFVAVAVTDHLLKELGRLGIFRFEHDTMTDANKLVTSFNRDAFRRRSSAN